MRYLVIGAGHLGRAIVAELKRQSIHADIARSQDEALKLLQGMKYPCVIDTAWSKPNDKAWRANRDLQQHNHLYAKARIDAAAPHTRYIGIGSQAELEPLVYQNGDSITLLIDGHLGIRTATDEYGKAKYDTAVHLLSKDLPGLWVRLCTILHRDMPVDSVYRKAAVSSHLPVADNITWCALSLEGTAQQIVQMAIEGHYGIKTLGVNHKLRSALSLINPDLEYIGVYSQHSVMLGISSVHMMDDYLTDLGNYWRKTAGKEQ